MSETHSKPLDLGAAPVGRLMVKYAVSCIISLLAATLYNIVFSLTVPVLAIDLRAVRQLKRQEAEDRSASAGQVSLCPA